MAQYRVNPSVVARRVEDQIVVVNLETNRIFALNRTAARFWELVSEGRDDEEIRTQLGREYSIDSGQLDGEMKRMVDELAGESLMVPLDGD